MVVVALDPKHKAFIVHVAALSVALGDEMHPLKRAQIAHLKADEAFTKIPSEYDDFTDVFSPKLDVELPEHIEINDHAIELVDDTQPPYDLIYRLRPIELEILKAYIKNNLARASSGLPSLPLEPLSSLTKSQIVV